MNSAALYTLQNVAKSYAGRMVLNIDDLEIRRGEVLAIVGPSGAGKSTLLRLLNFLEMPDSGALTFDGHTVQGRTTQGRTVQGRTVQGRTTNGGTVPLPLRREVTTVFQHPALLSTSVRHNVAYGLRLRGERNGKHAVDDVLDRLGLTALAHAPARTLSGGEAQRVALARALVLRPSVLLLDEPTANLDPYNVGLIETVIAELSRERACTEQARTVQACSARACTVVLVTHNVFQARRLAQRVALLLGGNAIEVAETATFFESPADPRTAAFVKGEMVC